MYLCGLGFGSRRVGECPGQQGLTGAVDSDAVVDLSLILGIRPSVHRQILREDVDGLVARPAQSVSENVTSVAVLNSVVVQVARVGLRAGGGVTAHVYVGDSDGGVGRGDHGDAVVGHVHVVPGSSAA